MMVAKRVTKLIVLFLCCVLLSSCSSGSSDYQSGYDAGYAAGYAAALKENTTTNVSHTKPAAHVAAAVNTLPTEPSYDYYVVNKKSKKFHIPSCGSVEQMKEDNKLYFSGTREELIENGYDPCGNCHP